MIIRNIDSSLSLLTFPIARSPLSKSIMTPRKMKATPNAANDAPTSMKLFHH